jgi:SNF2 family DNA or RNA helicase
MSKLDSTLERLGLWHHQLDGVEFASTKQAVYFQWGMGSGKTLATIAAARDSAVAVVVVPISVGPAWCRHYAKHDPDCEVAAIFSGTAAKRMQEIERVACAVGEGRRAAVIVNYDSVWRPTVARALEQLPIDMIVLDEAHRAKSPSGKASRYLALLAKRLPAARRLCLSGTPCPHSPLDLYAQFRFLDPSVFGTSYAAFRARYSIPHPKFPGAVLGYKCQDELAAKVAPYQHTISTDDVLSLPDAVHTRIDVPLSPAEERFYLQMERDLVAAVGSGEVVATNALTQFLRLQQAGSGHTVVGSGEPGDEKKTVILNGEKEKTSKGSALADWMADVPPHEPVVVFCRFREDLRQTALAAEANGRKCAELSGDSRELEVWQQADAEPSVIAVQIQSGGVGIDLTRANYCAFMSLGFSLGEYEQALARIRRPGQKQSCKYFHLLSQVSGGARPSLDEVVYGALSERKEIVDVVLDRIRTLGHTFGTQGKEHKDGHGFGAIGASKRRRK